VCLLKMGRPVGSLHGAQFWKPSRGQYGANTGLRAWAVLEREDCHRSPRGLGPVKPGPGETFGALAEALLHDAQ